MSHQSTTVVIPASRAWSKPDQRGGVDVIRGEVGGQVDADAASRLRVSDRHRWRCASTNPGMTIVSEASTTSAFRARSDGPTSLMIPSSIRTSAPTMLPTTAIERQDRAALDEHPALHRLDPSPAMRAPAATDVPATAPRRRTSRVEGCPRSSWAIGPHPLPPVALLGRGGCSATECTLRTHTWANSCTRFVQSDTTEGRGGGPVSQPTAPPLGRRIRARAHTSWDERPWVGARHRRVAEPDLADRDGQEPAVRKHALRHHDGARHHDRGAVRRTAWPGRGGPGPLGGRGARIRRAIAPKTRWPGRSPSRADAGSDGRSRPIVRPDEQEVLTLDSGVTWERLGEVPRHARRLPVDHLSTREHLVELGRAHAALRDRVRLPARPARWC